MSTGTSKPKVARGIRASGLLLLLFGLASAVAGSFWLAVKTANVASIERDGLQIEAGIINRATTIVRELVSYSSWDEAVTRSTRDRDIVWLTDQIALPLTKVNGHNMVFVLDATGKPLVAATDGIIRSVGTYIAVEPIANHLIEEISGTATETLQKEPDSGPLAKALKAMPAWARVRYDMHIVSVDGRPAIVAAATIRPQDDKTLASLPLTYIVSVKFIDDAFLSELGNQLGIGGLHLARAPENLDGPAKRQIVGDNGEPLGTVLWQPVLPGMTIVQTVGPVIGFVLLVFGILLIFLLQQLRRSYADVSAREEKAQFLARHDAMTGLPNRREFLERVNAIEREAGPCGYAVAYLDVDRFKDINDTMGHRAGDELIMIVAARLTEAFAKAGAVVARFGGDEFGIAVRVGEFLPEAVGEKLLDIFHSPALIDGQEVHVSVSCGVAVGSNDRTDAADMIRVADIALYKAKADGRACWRLFEPGMDVAVRNRREIEQDMRKALLEQQFELHYQPLVSAYDEATIGVEALMRWKHPTKGMISPTVFIPIAEETGFIVSLGEWAVRQACRDAMRWPGLSVAVNLSPVQFRHPNFLDSICKSLEETRIDPARIELEITEGILIEDIERAQRMLTALRAMGFRIALDDFGTGYSSLSYLQKFAFDKLKIDRSFVTDVGTSVDAAQIVQSVVSLGRALGMTVVAEGVETRSQADFLKAAGCRQFQGYYFAKPMKADDISARLNGSADSRAA